jgi:hypothetical protein
MCLPCGRELVLDAYMQLQFSATKPDPAPSAQPLRLLDLSQAQQSAVEAPRVGLAASRGGNLHMVKPDYAHRINVAHPAPHASCRRRVYALET